MCPALSSGGAPVVGVSRVCPGGTACADPKQIVYSCVVVGNLF